MKRKLHHYLLLLVMLVTWSNGAWAELLMPRTPSGNSVSQSRGGVAGAAMRAEDAVMKEKTLYKTKFQEWSALKSSTAETTVTYATADGQSLSFMLGEVEVKPDGTQTKFTSECITTGYLMAAKTATPYIKTTVLSNVTSVRFVHAATGSNRGWGLKVKGDGDADWVTVSDAVANPASGKEVTVNVNRTNVQLWFYNLNASQNAYMTELEIKGNVEEKARAFKDFKIDFRTDPYTVVAPETGLPEGVAVNAGTWHDNQHGYSGVKLTVPVDGPVKFTIGGCGYTDKATVSVDGAAPVNIDTNAAGCDNGFGTYTKNAVYTYNVEKPATLTFNLGSYCPYFMAEQCEYISKVTVSYFNTDGKLIGEDEVEGSSALKYKYTSADVTVPEGQAFRGWFASKSNTALKIAEGMELTEDLRLYARATPVEVAKVGTHYEYDLTKKYWYIEDHELISIDGNYHNDHGWIAKSVSVDVAGRCYVNVKNCLYTAEQTVVVTDSKGNKMAEFDGKGAADGAVSSFTYDGEPTTLTITYPSKGYVHGVEVYNVADFVAYDAESGYYKLSSGDASSLMLILKSAKSGDKIFLPNGVYDFGEVALTTISANNLSIIGESMEGTVIRNAPDKSTEGIGTTATLLNTSDGLYLQDLTIQNALDYYATGSAGCAVCLQDKGKNTICKNVRMLSYQDTYYSNSASRFYWEDSEIHGTVDYLCGDGDIIYNRCKFVNESRAKDKRDGSDVIAAPYTSASCQWGYVFLDCSVESLCKDFSFARSWGGESKAQFLNTTILDNSLNASRFTASGMNVAAYKFKEYNTKNAEGTVVSPTSNVMTFTHSTGDKKYETILTDAEAATYTVANIFGSWAPDATAAQVTDISKGSVFLVNGEITTVAPTSGKVRIANARGGFGPEVEVRSTGISDLTASVSTNGGVRKVIVGDRLVIVKGNSLYTISGALVK